MHPVIADRRDCPCQSGMLHTLEPEDSRALQRAVTTASSDHEHEYAAYAEEFMLAFDHRSLVYRLLAYG
jgi:hypothetical protein